MKINIETLEETAAGQIIAKGEAQRLSPINPNKVMKWIAFKDYEGRWVVKYGEKYCPDPVIMTIGLPVVDLDTLKLICNCDSEVLWYYGENPYHRENKSGKVQEIFDALVSLQGKDEAERIFKSCELEAYQEGHPLPEILKGEYQRVISSVHA